MASLKNILLSSAAVAVALAYSGCSKDEEAFQPNGGWQAEQVASQGSAQGAALRRAGSVVIDFSDFSETMMAGPTSYGENYYSASAAGHQVKRITNGVFTSDVNSSGGKVEFWNGGIALSKWNYYKNIDSSLPKDWWYSYKNQMSVYNRKVGTGQNHGAGRGGDNNFGVVFGYVDSYNQQFGAKKPSFSLDKARRLVGLWICNSSYTYGVIQYGNQFGSVGVAKPLQKSKGYFKVVLECYNEEGKLLATYDHMLADYRQGKPEVQALESWTYWQIGQDGVKTVKFNFEGSDTGTYGLNTPAYVCIDDIEVR